MLHMIGFPLLVLLLSPLLLVAAPFYSLRFAAWRKPIPEFVPPQIDDDHSETLRASRTTMSRINSARWAV